MAPEAVAPVPEPAPPVAEPAPPVASPRCHKNRDSFVETKEEIVDDLEFIKSKLATPPETPAAPTAPVKGKRASKEIKEVDVTEVKTAEDIKEVLENVEEKGAAAGVEGKAELAGVECIPPGVECIPPGVECIPPVRPQRTHGRAGARLSVPQWQPPRQGPIDYTTSRIAEAIFWLSAKIFKTPASQT